jgi:hypothetical protein
MAYNNQTTTTIIVILGLHNSAMFYEPHLRVDPKGGGNSSFL